MTHHRKYSDSDSTSSQPNKKLRAEVMTSPRELQIATLWAQALDYRRILEDTQQAYGETSTRSSDRRYSFPEQYPYERKALYWKSVIERQQTTIIPELKKIYLELARMEDGRAAHELALLYEHENKDETTKWEQLASKLGYDEKQKLDYTFLEKAIFKFGDPYLYYITAILMKAEAKALLIERDKLPAAHSQEQAKEKTSSVSTMMKNSLYYYNKALSLGYKPKPGQQFEVFDDSEIPYTSLSTNTKAKI